MPEYQPVSVEKSGVQAGSLPTLLAAIGLWIGLYLLLSLGAATAAAGTVPERAFEDFVRDAWSLEDGLPQRSVTAIAQGPQGYIWVGTQHALARFDGVRFREFTTQSEPAIPSNDISVLHTDGDQALWIGTQRGLARYVDGEFHRIALHGDTDRMSDLTITALTSDQEGVLWVGAEEGLFRVSDDVLVAVETPGSGPVGAVFADNSTLLVGGTGRYWQFENGRPATEHWLPPEAQSSRVTAFARHHGLLWLGTSDGVFRHQRHQAYPVPFDDGLEGEPVNVLFEDSSHTLWIGADAAMLRIHGGELVERIDNDHPNSHAQTRSLHEDHEGNLWLGSRVDGVARYWSGWVDRFSESAGLEEPLVWSVADDGENGLWVGTSGGLFRLDGARFTRQIDSRDLPHPHAYTLAQQDGQLWIGTRRGLIILDPADGELVRPEIFEVLDGLQVNGIVPAGPHGRFFFATLQGLYLWRGGDDMLRIETSIGSRSVRQVRLLKGEEILVATDNGAFRGPPQQLRHLGEETGLDRNGDYVSARQLKGDWISLSTLDAGLFIGNDDGYRQLTSDEGLPSDSSYHLSVDREGFLWVGGFEGLYRVEIDQLIQYALGARHAVDAEMIISESGRHPGSQQGYCCNGAGHAKGLMRLDGLWLPTRDGVVRVRPDRIDRNPVAPNVVIERYRSGEEWRRVDSSSRQELIRGYRDPAFEFTGLSFRDPSSIRFRYRLSGFEDSWQELGGRMPRTASYTNLPPGDYRFEVTVSNNVGVWAQQPAMFEFRIPAYFHETVGFQLLMAAAFMALLMAAYYWRRHQWGQRQDALRQEVRLRTEELRITNARLVEANDALKQLSTTDPLTGLHNRRYLYEQMENEPQRLARLREQMPEDDPVLGFALIDVDHFKRINDNHGHHIGDRVLGVLGDRLNRFARTGDHVVRWGGEEFLVVFQGLPRSHSTSVLQRLFEATVSRPVEMDDQVELEVTCSIGFAELPLLSDEAVDMIGWESVVEIADQALYRVKRRGRNGWALIRPSGNLNSVDFVQAVREDLDTVLDQGQVEIIFSNTVT